MLVRLDVAAVLQQLFWVVTFIMRKHYVSHWVCWQVGFCAVRVTMVDFLWQWIEELKFLHTSCARDKRMITSQVFVSPTLVSSRFPISQFINLFYMKFKFFNGKPESLTRWAYLAFKLIDGINVASFSLAASRPSSAVSNYYIYHHFIVSDS